jgi:GNAT superfamily N-acetyltransferase
VIEDAMNQSPSSVLLLASGPDGRPEGFALLAPTQSDELQVELRYLGVRPAAWGRSVASTLLEAIADSVRDGHHTGAELWVYEDNTRACLLYERHGWRQEGTPRVHARSSRVERRYVLNVNRSS